jgi:hypothetical protein
MLEEYLKFRVDTDIFFLLRLHSQNEPQIRSEGKERDKRPEHELLSTSLKDLVSLAQPKNVDALQTSLVDRAKRPFWSRTSFVISNILPRIVPLTPITSEHKAFEFKELGDCKFTLHSVCSKTCQLEEGFRVRIC